MFITLQTADGEILVNPYHIIQVVAFKDNETRVLLSVGGPLMVKEAYQTVVNYLDSWTADYFNPTLPAAAPKRNADSQPYSS